MLTDVFNQSIANFSNIFPMAITVFCVFDLGQSSYAGVPQPEMRVNTTSSSKSTTGCIHIKQ